MYSTTNLLTLIGLKLLTFILESLGLPGMLNKLYKKKVQKELLGLEEYNLLDALRLPQL